MQKSQIPIAGVGGWVGQGAHSQLLMLSPEILKSQIPISGAGGGGEAHGQLLMLSPEMLKSQIPIFWWWVGGWDMGCMEFGAVI